jgi:glutamine amidotransferase
MSKPRVCLLDYGVGNIHSLRKALERGGARVQVTGDARRLLQAEAVVLPGVGGFAAGARSIQSCRAGLRKKLESGTPCLAVCLGMQLLFEASEEDAGRGIGLVPGRVRRLAHRRLPHIGWNSVRHSGTGILRGIPRDAMFYFVHSYAPSSCGDACVATAEYGQPFAAVVAKGPVWGVQFHPEKSSRWGLALIRNWIRTL